jgi:hypothetical protein
MRSTSRLVLALSRSMSRAGGTPTRIVAPAVAGILLAFGASEAVALCVNPGGTGGCLASVQAAVDAAAPNEVIDVAPGTYVENISIPEGSLLTIQGTDAATTILDAGVPGAFIQRVLLIKGPRTKVTLSRLTIRNGSTSGAASGMFLMWNARVTLVDSIVTQNNGGPALACGDGGATLIVRDSIVTANDDNGIGLNSTTGLSRGCRLTVSRSTIANNGGHGIRATRPTKVEDSTITGNAGAGIEAVGGVVVTIRGSTIVGNAAGGVAACNGFADRTVVNVRATILADNTVGGSPNDCDVACDARFRSRGFNLLESCPSVAQPAPTDVLGVDPLLGPLQDNGGPTPTHALLAGSPAVGEVTRAGLCREPDQRGQPRVLPCDIGAFEAP